MRQYHNIASPSSAAPSYSSQGKMPTSPIDYVEFDGHLVSSIKMKPSSSRLPQSQSKVTLVSPKEGGVMDGSISSSSPDSAMQHSFSSESSTGSGSSCASNGTGATRRDDGYSSNSTVSTVSLADLHHDLAVRSRSSMDVPPSYNEATKRDSFCSVQSSSSAENSCAGRVRDIKARFEGPTTSCYGKKLAPPPPPKPSREKIQAVQSKKLGQNISRHRSNSENGENGAEENGDVSQNGQSNCQNIAKPNTNNKAKLVTKLPKILFKEIRNKCSGRSSSKTKSAASPANNCGDDHPRAASNVSQSETTPTPKPILQKSNSEPALCPPSCVREHRLRVFQKHLKCSLEEITELVHRSTMQLDRTLNPGSLQTESLTALKAMLLSDWSKLQQKSTNPRAPYELPHDLFSSIPFSSDDSRSSSLIQGHEASNVGQDSSNIGQRSYGSQRLYESQRSSSLERSIGEGAEVNPHRASVKPIRCQRPEGDGSECSSPMSPEEAELQMVLGLPYYNCLAVNVVIGETDSSALSSASSQWSTPGSPLVFQTIEKSPQNNNCCLQDHPINQSSSNPSSPGNATIFSQSDFGPRLLGQSEESKTDSLSQSLPCKWGQQNSDDTDSTPQISRKCGGCVPMRKSSRLPTKVDKPKVPSGVALQNYTSKSSSSPDHIPAQDRAVLLDQIASKSDLYKKGQGHRCLRNWVIGQLQQLQV